MVFFCFLSFLSIGSWNFVIRKELASPSLDGTVTRFQRALRALDLAVLWSSIAVLSPQA
jgi:hypothetical protein